MAWSAARAVATGCVLAVGAGALAACGSTTTLDAAGAGRQIGASLARRFSVPAPKVTCPAGVEARVGRRFACTAALDSQTLRIDATVITASGQFQPVLADAVLVVSQAETALSSEVGTQVGQSAAVTCPSPHKLAVEAPGAHLACRAMVGGVTRPLDVTVTNTAGAVTFTLGGAGGSATTPSTLPGPP
ncbi:MAG: DUF4333 domain-containing protein [Acidimicrobiales bacterium]